MKESFLNTLQLIPQGIIIVNSQDKEIIFANDEINDNLRTKDTTIL